jgi:hypothetical protein
MKTEQEYIRDLTEIRSMMERSTKFLSLTGWSGIMAGLYALAGAYIGYKLFYLNTEAAFYHTIDARQVSGNVLNFFLLALVVLVLAIGTAIFLSWRKSKKTGEKIWNAASRRLLINLAIPLAAGGVFVLILFSKGMIGLIAPVTLLFYGLALLNAGKFTYEEVKYFGIIEIVLGLLASYFIGYGLLFWAFGFGIMHIVYGIYMHLKYEK